MSLFVPFFLASFDPSPPSSPKRGKLHRRRIQATLAPLVRIQENVPQFKIPPLEPGREYHFQVYAVNAKGRSDPPYIIERVRVGSLLSPYGKYVQLCCQYRFIKPTHFSPLAR